MNFTNQQFRIILLLWSFTCFFLGSRAQDNLVQDVVYPAPNAASLGKYGDIPVSYHTGLPQISLPIHTVQEGSLSLPISLSYHAAGIKVAEMSSWVGLGWSLNAGGIISRVVRNAPDEDASYNQHSGYWANYGYSFNPNTSEVQNLNRAAAGEIDTEPDLFSFNVGGYTGKFFFNENREAILVPQQDIEIEVQFSQLPYGYSFDEWMLTTPDGVKYFFGGTGAVEKSASTSGYVFQTSMFVPSSWYLRRIESAGGEHAIDLEYVPEQYAYYNTGSEYSVGGSGSCPAPTVAPNPVKTVVQGVRLSRIVSTLQEVQFVANHARQDLSAYILGTQSGTNTQAKALDAIEIREADGSCFRRFEIQHSYFQSSSSGSNLNFDPDHTDFKRLRLDGLQQVSCDGASSLPAHAFQYYHKIGLPRRLSFAQDHWGYFNGYVNNIVLTPKKVATTQATCTGGAIRTPNASRVREWSLNRIDYPTGGNTRFEMEINRVPTYNFGQGNQSLAGGLRVKTITHDDGDNNPANHLVQTFLYQTETGGNSGQLMSPVVYASPLNLANLGTTFPASILSCPGSAIIPLMFSSQSLAPMHHVSGSPIGYSRVEMHQTDRGHSVYEYALHPYQPGNQTFPLEDIPYDPGNGNLLKERHYNEQGILQAETEYQYQNAAFPFNGTDVSLGNSYFPGIMKVQLADVSSVCNQMTTGMSTIHGRKGYPMITGFHRMSQKIERSFDPTGNYSLSKKTTFHYDNNLHHQLTREQVFNSDGRIHTTEYRYAHELGETLLLQRNMVGIPLEVRQKINGQLTGGSKTVYQSFGNSVLPKEHYQILSDGSTVLRATQSQYGSKGNMRQYHLEGGEPTAYLWGAQSLRPIAKILNARWDETAYAGFEDEGSNTTVNGRFRIVGSNPLYDSDAKTGQKALRLHQSGQYVYRHLQYTATLTGEYLLSFWYKGGSIRVKKGGSLIATAPSSNTWKYFEKKVSLNNLNQLTLSPPNGTLPLLDEVRLHPVDAQMTTYAYNGSQQLITVTDLNQRPTRYEYDGFNRLRGVRDHNDHYTTAYDYLLSNQPSTAPSFIRKKQVRVSGTTQLSLIPMYSSSGKEVATSYLDGLGRTVQTVMEQASPSQKDWITPHVFDHRGQESQLFLPFSATHNNGQFHFNAPSAQAAFYSNHPELSHLPAVDRAVPFSPQRFEDSPLGRLVEAGAPGAAWQMPTVNSAHTQKTLYRSNQANYALDEVRIWLEGANGQFLQAGLYPAGTLSVTEQTDENGHRTITYSDKLGRMILQRVQETDQSHYQNATAWASTYYLYGKRGQLRFVIQPEGEMALRQHAWNLYTADILEDFAFCYEYDLRNRLLRKRVPGSDWETYIYDKLDRIVMRQDGKLKGDKRWMITKYDKLGRPVISGVKFVGGVAASNLQLQADNNTVLAETPAAATYSYSNQAFPLVDANTSVYAITYFDDYDFNRNGTLQVNESHEPEPMLSGFSSNGMNSRVNLRTRGQVTGIKVQVLDGNNTYLMTRTYYDQYGRELQTLSDNHLGGFDRLTYDKNFVGEVVRSLHYHTTGSTTVQSYQYFLYDHAGRIKQVQQDVKSGTGTWTLQPVLLSSLTYNELGQLKEKNLHSENQGTTFLQSVDYLYNIRGWMRKLNELPNCSNVIASGMNPGGEDIGGGNEPTPIPPGGDHYPDLFAMELRYETGTSDLPEATDPLFNGNISGMLWQTNGSCNISAYSFAYDAMDRLLEAEYGQKNGFTGNWSLQPDRYTVSGIQYDKNGNIQTLNRQGVSSYSAANGTFGFGLMDALSYTYKGNRLAKVEDAAIVSLPASVPQFNNGVNAVLQLSQPNTFEYRYDANGNMTADDNKGIAVQYNYFNKPTQVEYIDPTDSRFGQKIRYLYLGDGTKLQQTVLTASGQPQKQTDYVSGFQYEAIDANQNGTLDPRELKFFAHEEGRIRADGNAFAYEYTLKDHLGNARVTFGDPDNNGTPDLLQEDHYYPFGLQHSGSFLQATPAQEYRYNGKERQDELGLGWVDYGFRWYMADIGRFVSVDPLAQDFYHLTTYQYGSNSPVYMIDLDGLEGVNPQEITADDVTTAAENATTSVTEKYGSVSAVCNFGVRQAVYEITGSKSLYPNSVEGGQVVGNGQANTIGTSLANGDVTDFEQIDEVDLETMQADVNDGGTVIVGVYSSAESGSGGHIVLVVPGTVEHSGSHGKFVLQVMENGANHRKSKTKFSTNVRKETASEMKWFLYTGPPKEEVQEEEKAKSPSAYSNEVGCERY